MSKFSALIGRGIVKSLSWVKKPSVCGFLAGAGTIGGAVGSILEHDKAVIYKEYADNIKASFDKPRSYLAPAQSEDMKTFSGILKQMLGMLELQSHRVNDLFKEVETLKGNRIKRNEPNVKAEARFITKLYRLVEANQKDKKPGELWAIVEKIIKTLNESFMVNDHTQIISDLTSEELTDAINELMKEDHE